jgi:hypothetical protein
MSEPVKMDAEARLARFWREDGLADHDGAFAVMVAQRMARKRLRWSLAALGGLSLLAALVLWALAPWLASLAERFGDRIAVWGPVAVVVIVVASVVFMTGLPMSLPSRLGDELGDGRGA